MSIISRLLKLYHTSSSNRYVSFLRARGVYIGEGTVFRSPGTVEIDYSRPELLEIGEHVFIHKGVVIMTHDWASWCFVHSHNDFIPSHAKVKIGNNVWFGENVSVCKGVTIGDNCIIGIGSVVTKDIPANSIAVGVPAKVIGSYEDYYSKRKNLYVSEAIEYARAIIAQGRDPQIEDFYDDYPCFVDGENYMDYDYPYCRVFNQSEFDHWKIAHKKVFNDFEEFINFVKLSDNV